MTRKSAEQPPQPPTPQEVDIGKVVSTAVQAALRAAGIVTAPPADRPGEETPPPSPAIARTSSRVNLARTSAQTQATPPQPQAPKEPKTPSIRARVEAALAKESLNAAQLAKATGASVQWIGHVIKELRAEHKLFNAGQPENPTWVLRIGDKTDSPTLRNMIVRLLKERPMLQKELVEATGAREGRVSGQIVEIQRSDLAIKNLYQLPHTKLYWIDVNQAKDMRLGPRRPKKR